MFLLKRKFKYNWQAEKWEFVCITQIRAFVPKQATALFAQALAVVLYPEQSKRNLNGWFDISVAPRSGEILIKNGDNVFISEYRPDVVDGSGFGSIHSCCGYYEDIEPTHWKRI